MIVFSILRTETVDYGLAAKMIRTPLHFASGKDRSLTLKMIVFSISEGQKF